MIPEKILEQVFELLKLEQVTAHALVNQMAGGSEFGASWHRLVDLEHDEDLRENHHVPSSLRRFHQVVAPSEGMLPVHM